MTRDSQFSIAQQSVTRSADLTVPIDNSATAELHWVSERNGLDKLFSTEYRPGEPFGFLFLIVSDSTSPVRIEIAPRVGTGTDMIGKKMEKRGFGKTDINVSVLGFGGSEIGYERASLSSVSKSLNRALDAGLNVIDTAECYVTSEELIGNAISARRGDYYLFTKCGHERGWSYPDWRPSSL